MLFHCSMHVMHAFNFAGLCSQSFFLQGIARRNTRIRYTRSQSIAQHGRRLERREPEQDT